MLYIILYYITYYIILYYIILYYIILYYIILYYIIIICDNISVISSQKETLQTNFVQNIKTHILYSTASYPKKIVTFRRT